MKSRLFLIAGLIVASATAQVFVQPLAMAQTEDQKTKAREHFKNARRLYDLGKYKDAIEAYQQAYLNVEDPVFLYNIAQSYRLDNQPEEAIRFYKTYLRRSPEAGNRADVEQKMAELQKEIETKQANQPPKTEPRPESPPVVVQPPPPDPSTVTPPPPDVSVGATTAPPTSDDSPTLAYGLLIGGGAGVALATIFGAVANSKAKTLESATVFDPAVERSGKAFNTAAVIFGVAGVAAAGTGLYLLLTRDSSTEAAQSSGSRVASNRRSLSVFPAVGPGYAGAGAGFNF
ncbi:MAG: tetratricopeptide repeat protein [Deltaproteobacteria bacterium]|nr:tetratricopeptide repeat protein [Deltaproteobacteria bacterium]